MATTTPNFGWPVPTSTDLVKDGATAIEGLGDAIDASLLDLKGGTTNQVLAKNSNTDMDFKWVADAAGMTNPMTTTGDTIYSSSGSTPARLAIGTTGQVLTVAGGVPTWATAGGGSFNTGYAYTSSTQNTTSSSYTDLSTVTSVTVTTGTKALVAIKSQLGNETLGGGVWGRVSFAVSGATTLAASNERSIGSYSTLGSQWINAMGATFVVEGLTAGSNTFTLKFTAGGGYTTPATFYERSISVMNLGS